MLRARVVRVISFRLSRSAPGGWKSLHNAMTSNAGRTSGAPSKAAGASRKPRFSAQRSLHIGHGPMCKMSTVEVGFSLGGAGPY